MTGVKLVPAEGHMATAAGRMGHAAHAHDEPAHAVSEGQAGGELKGPAAAGDEAVRSGEGVGVGSGGVEVEVKTGGGTAGDKKGV